ncbi:MAG: class I SAM-dependent methyltransferase [Defluviitaleaceae bacterium]|nr:class I SAM-dependent methyltransferase [Defluviitaleaceae bacterium]
MFKEYGELSTMLYEHKSPVGHSYGGDIEYYYDKLKSVSSPILEAGVGTGRVLIPLIQKGLKVDGVDLSPEMLAQCRTNLGKHGAEAELHHQDLTKMSLPSTYGAIIMPTGSFCLLPKSIVNDVLTSFYNHLDEDGVVILDLLLPTDFVSGKVESLSYELGNGAGILFTIHSRDADWVSQKVSYIIGTSY